LEQRKKVISIALAVFITILWISSDAIAQNDPCVAPDNGTGTVDLPANCPYTTWEVDPMVIMDGLPPGTTIELDASFQDFICSNPILCTGYLDPGECEGEGGSLGGHFECFESTLDLIVTGTGLLEGFTRHLAVPMSCEIHTGPRTPGEPVQAFPADMYRLQGELFGDPDFCEFIVIGGTDFGLPCPGQTTLEQLPSDDFAVDSFFDITYQIEFAGCPGSVLDGYAGTTTATVHWQQGVGEAPVTGACCRPDGTCLVTTETNCQNIGGTYQGNDTQCLGDGDGDGYDDLCYPQGTCLAPDNGTGTVDLPADCPYLPVDEVMLIIDGLPPGTTIELDPILLDFFCDGGTSCSLPIPGEGCEGEGGSLGGNYHCFESTLDLTVTGTGELTGFNRHLAVPIMCEVHTGPRNPGDPVQTFPSVMFRFDGELFGDPDFCTFRVRAGEDNGLPSPGYTTLTELGGGNFNIDSFFDITYQIEFEGCPGSVLSDYAGITTATIRLKQGSGEAETPPVGACCRLDGTCALTTGTYCSNIGGTYDGDDSHCLGDGDGDGYDDLCFPQGTCLAPDNGTGTVTLPAMDCDFIAPYEPMYIIDGLPPYTTIELEAIFTDFVCDYSELCSMPLSPGECETEGGSLGGHGHCFEATLDLTVTGTGELAGFNRHLAVPISCEIHTGPRTPGESVQAFAADMYRLQGELFGDPDFCTFRVTGGTDFGLPSPGEMTLTDVGGGLYNVDSFFDVMYQIEFEGCPGSQLEDYAGTTTEIIYIQQGPPPPTGACCLSDGSCIETIEIDCLGIGTYQGDWTVCLGDGNGDGVDDACPVPPSCIAPDNGTGTVNLPADCPYLPVDEVMLIIDGLPPGTTIELDPILLDFFCGGETPCSLPIPGESCEDEGGSLGGHYHCFESTLDLTVSGTGELAGFNRHLAVPISCEVHTGPRNPGDPVQTFPSVMFRFEGELFGDPDFCTFRVSAGEDNGLPSPGYTTLTELGGGDFNVDSFFDITYQIEFEGCPASQLEDYSGTTTATIRLKQGSGEAETPPVGACCRLDGTCALTTETYCGNIGGEYYGNDSECWGDGDGDGYDDLCFPQGTCHAPDNGTGTVDLPADCPYKTSEDDPMVIIDGFPPGTTVEMDAVVMDFLCTNPELCSGVLDPNDCEDEGGSLGGHFECFEATLDLTVTGTGELEGFSRHLAVPISCEIHTGPRNPGDPVQSFDADMYRLQGELFGDPDFCTFRVTGGTDFGLPSSGHTTLEQLPSGDFNVDSFFDITYQIEFEGCPGSVLDSYSGTTMATVRWQQGVGGAIEPIPTLSEWGIILLALLLLATGTIAVIRRQRTVTVNQ